MALYAEPRAIGDSTRAAPWIGSELPDPRQPGVRDLLVRSTFDEMPVSAVGVEIKKHLRHQHHVHGLTVGRKRQEQHLRVALGDQSPGPHEQRFRVDRLTGMHAFIVEPEHVFAVFGPGSTSSRYRPVALMPCSCMFAVPIKRYR
jgi:hypothetical protein